MRAWVTAPLIGAGTDDDPIRPLLDDLAIARFQEDPERWAGQRLEYVVGDHDLALCAVDVEELDDLLGGKVKRIKRVSKVHELGKLILPEFDPAAHLGDSPPPETGSFLLDNFTAADGTRLDNPGGGSYVPDSGGTWTQHTSYIAAGGTCQIYSNRCGGSVATMQCYYSVAPAGVEYTVTGVFHQVTAAGTAGVCARVSTTQDDNYRARYVPGTGYQLRKSATGTASTLGTYTHTISGDETVDLQCLDATKKVFVAGVEQISSTDNAITAAGRAGVAINAGSTTGIHMDSVTATDYVAPTTPRGMLLGVG